MVQLFKAMSDTYSDLAQQIGWPGALAVLCASALLLVGFARLMGWVARRAASRVPSRFGGLLAGGLAAAGAGAALGLLAFGLADVFFPGQLVVWRGAALGAVFGLA